MDNSIFNWLIDRKQREVASVRKYKRQFEAL